LATFSRRTPSGGSVSGSPAVGAVRLSSASVVSAIVVHSESEDERDWNVTQGPPACVPRAGSGSRPACELSHEDE
jgi:hypothetical protein